MFKQFTNFINRIRSPQSMQPPILLSEEIGIKNGQWLLEREGISDLLSEAINPDIRLDQSWINLEIDNRFPDAVGRRYRKSLAIVFQDYVSALCGRNREADSALYYILAVNGVPDKVAWDLTKLSLRSFREKHNVIAMDEYRSRLLLFSWLYLNAK